MIPFGIAIILIILATILGAALGIRKSNKGTPISKNDLELNNSSQILFNNFEYYNCRSPRQIQ